MLCLMSKGRSTSHECRTLDSACGTEERPLQECSQGSSQQREDSHLNRRHNNPPPLLLLFLQLDEARRPQHVKDMHCAFQAVAESQRLHTRHRQRFTGQSKSTAGKYHVAAGRTLTAGVHRQLCASPHTAFEPILSEPAICRTERIAGSQLCACCTPHHAVPVSQDSCIEIRFGSLNSCFHAADAVGALLDAAPHLLIEPVLLTFCELPCRPAEQAAQCRVQCSALPPAIL